MENNVQTGKETAKIMIPYFPPEGELLETTENRARVSSAGAIEIAMQEGRVVEGVATLCDRDMRLHIDLGAFAGVMEPADCVYLRPGETQKDIAVITRVGKPIAGKITSVEMQNGRPVVHLSRREAQKECLESYFASLRPGDILPARVTHLEPFGAFLDIGCGLSSLLSVDCISVSRIAHPMDRLRVGQMLPVAVKCMQRESERIYVTLRELLGTWEENAASFAVGQTVTGLVRSVEAYGVFVELAPNLAGLAEVKAEVAEELRGKIGKPVSVYIKSILPERMKIKLVLIDSVATPPTPMPLRFYTKEGHIDRWRYSPASCAKVVETVF